MQNNVPTYENTSLLLLLATTFNYRVIIKESQDIFYN